LCSELPLIPPPPSLHSPSLTPPSTQNEFTKKQWEPWHNPVTAQALRSLADFDTQHPAKPDMPLVGKRRQGEGRGMREEREEEREKGKWRDKRRGREKAEKGRE